ncbi:hypothetical protein MiSe_93080 [Microseira wollei NIES-4236]|uniref:Secreted protein n=1 Tax=Microseira wollei NIES-4236 TaxID=2530354 RepID=A0AAV3XPJ7_9CYAN|nr:hypothetical protein MiSe_93080 [Microseira wollei NIES-4236]
MVKVLVKLAPTLTGAKVMLPVLSVISVAPSNTLISALLDEDEPSLSIIVRMAVFCPPIVALPVASDKVRLRVSLSSATVSSKMGMLTVLGAVSPSPQLMVMKLLS